MRQNRTSVTEKWRFVARFVAVIAVVIASLYFSIAVLGQSMPIVSIADEILAVHGGPVQVPVSIAKNGQDVTSVAFTIDYDQACLNFSNTDVDSNGIPDAIAFHVPHTRIVLQTGDSEGELDIALVDLLPPFAQLPSGPILTITFTPQCNPAAGVFVIAPILLVPSSVSFGDSLGREAQGVSSGGSMRIVGPITNIIPPTFAEIDSCDSHGSIAIPAQPGVTYKRAGMMVSGTITGLQGSQTIDAVSASGYLFASGVTTSWTEDLGTYTHCANPVAPVFVNVGHCNVYGSIKLTAADGVLYHHAGNAIQSGTISGLEGSQTVTASVSAGYLFTNTAVLLWTGQLGDFRTCAKPLEPTVTTIQACNNYGSISYTPVTGVTYSMNPPGAVQGWVEVSASPASASYALTDDTSPWSYDLGVFYACPPEGIAVTPEIPSVTAITTCNQDGAVHLPDQVGVLFAYSPTNAVEGVITVTATPKPGYFFPVSAVSQWTFDLGSRLICATPTEPPHEEAGIGKWGKILLPAIPGVEYIIEDVEAIEGKVKVTARVKSGYGFPPGTTFEWIIDLGDYLIPAAPVQPTVTPISACGTYGSVIFATTPGVTYSMTPADAKAGKVTVAATPWADYGLVGYDGPWEYDLGEYKDCPEPSGDGIVWLPMVHRLVATNQ